MTDHPLSKRQRLASRLVGCFVLLTVVVLLLSCAVAMLGEVILRGDVWSFIGGIIFSGAVSLALYIYFYVWLHGMGDK